MWDYLRLFGGGPVQGIIVSSALRSLLTVDVGPRSNTGEVVEEPTNGESLSKFN